MTMAFVPSSVVVPEQQHWHHQARRTRPRRVASVTSATRGDGGLWRPFRLSSLESGGGALERGPIARTAAPGAAAAPRDRAHEGGRERARGLGLYV